MFDDALLESRKDHSLGGRRFSLPLAIGFHFLVIGAFLGASAWITEDVPEPVLTLVFPGPSAAPHPPLGGGEVAHTPRGTRPRPEAMTQPVAPIETDIAEPKNAGPTQIGSHDSEIPGPGLPTGEPDGTDPSALAARTGSPEQIFTTGGDVRAPVLIQRVDPDYPEAARRAHLQGTVVLEAIITASGDVEEIRVARSLSPLLDQAALTAVRQWRYRPATLNGRAVRVYLTVTIKYGLN